MAEAKEVEPEPSLGEGTALKDFDSTTNEGDELHGVKDQVDPTRLARTILIAFAWVLIGLFVQAIDYSLPWYENRLGVSKTDLSSALRVTMLGDLVGCAVGGILSDRLPRLIDLWLGGAMLAGSVASLTVAHSLSLRLFVIMFYIRQFGKGVILTAGNYFVLKLWSKKAAPANHALHFSFALGVLMARPLRGNIAMVTSRWEALHNNLTSGGVMSNNVTSGQTPADYHVPFWYFQLAYYLIGGVMFITAALFFLFLKLRKPLIYPKKTLKEMLNFRLAVKGNCCLGAIVFILIMGFFALSVAEECIYSRFVYLFATAGACQFTNKDGILLEMVYSLLFTVGRGLMVLLALCVKPVLVLGLEIATNVAASFLLMLGADRSASILWTGSSLYGASLSALVPVFLSWLHLRTEITGVVMGVLNAVIVVSNAASVSVMSAVVESRGPSSLMPAEFGTAVVLVIISVLVVIIIKCWDRKTKGSASYDKLQ